MGGSHSVSSDAPRWLALHMLRQHASVPPTLAHDDVCTTPPQPSPSAGAPSAPCAERLEQRKAHDIFDIPTNKRQCAQVIAEGAHVGARARSAYAFGAELVARGGSQAAAGAWAERVARRGDGSQRLPRPVHRRAAPAAHPERGAPARNASGSAMRRLVAGAERAAPTSSATSARPTWQPGGSTPLATVGCWPLHCVSTRWKAYAC